MKTRILSLLITLGTIITLPAHAQFQRMLGDNFDIYSGQTWVSMVQETDTRNLVFLFNETFQHNPVIVKTDSTGAIIWTKTIAMTNLFSTKLVLTANNTYVMGASIYTSATNYYRMVLMEIDKTGTILWSKFYDCGYSTSLVDLSKTNDNGYLVIGNPNPGGANGILALKTNASGLLQWHKIIKKSGSYCDNPKGFEIPFDGIYIATTQGYDSYGLMKLAYNTGDTIWTKELFSGDAMNLLGTRSFGRTHDNNLFIADNITGNRFVNLKINTAGTILWQNAYNSDFAAKNIYYDTKGELLITGRIGGLGYEASLLKLKSDGTIRWCKTYGGYLNDYASDMIPHSKGYFIGGVTSSYLPTPNNDKAGILLIKTDTSGVAINGCYEGEMTFSTVTNLTFTNKTTSYILETKVFNDTDMVFSITNHASLANLNLTKVAVTIPKTKNPLCAGSSDGYAKAAATGGFGGFTYIWQGTGVSADSLGGRTAGKYIVTAQDSKGCKSKDSVTLTDPPALTLALTATKPSCPKIADGVINSTPGGGTPPYRYDWSNTRKTQNITGLLEGKYKLTLKDTNNCVLIDSLSFLAQRPDTPTICMVSIQKSTNKNMIIWDRYNGNRISYYKIYKEVVTNQYDSIGITPFDSVSVYIDKASKPDMRAEKYKLTAVDVCGTETPKSPFHQTMNLTKNGTEPNISLIWNKYIDESGSWIPKNYIIYRGMSMASLTKYDSLPDLSSFNYNIKDAAPGEIFYVAVNKGSLCSPAVLKAESGPYSQSLSNILEFKSSAFYPVSITGVRAYPNPCTDKLYLEFTLEKGSDVKIQLYNSAGIEVSSMSASGSIAGPNKLAIDVSGQANGYYSIKITSDSYSKVIPFVKQ